MTRQRNRTDRQSNHYVIMHITPADFGVLFKGDSQEVTQNPLPPQTKFCLALLISN